MRPIISTGLSPLGALNFRYAQLVVLIMHFGARHFGCISENVGVHPDLLRAIKIVNIVNHSVYTACDPSSLFETYPLFPRSTPQ